MKIVKELRFVLDLVKGECTSFSVINGSYFTRTKLPIGMAKS